MKLLKLASHTTLAATISTLFAGMAYASDATPLARVPKLDAQANYTDQLIIKYRSGASALSSSTAKADRLSKQLGIKAQSVRKTARGAEIFKLGSKVSLEQATLMAANLAAKDASIEYAEADAIAFPTAEAPNDQFFADRQNDLWDTVWGIDVLNAWDTSRGNGVVVAVLDTGKLDHPDLIGNLLPGYDFVSSGTIDNGADGNGRDADPTEPWFTGVNCGSGAPRSSSWHGSHVAGTIAAVTNNNNRGVAGIAPNSKILPVRVLGKCGGYDSDISDAIIWASGGSIEGVPANATPAKVINMSLGGSGGCSKTRRMALADARARGTVIVVAAGNSSMDASNFSPANCPGVINVAATVSMSTWIKNSFGWAAGYKNGSLAEFSNYGPTIDVAAPGYYTLSTVKAANNGPFAYGHMAGTSMAAPHVAGVAALMLAANPNLTPDQVEAIIKRTARALPYGCMAQEEDANGNLTGVEIDRGQCGTGTLDAAAAVKAALAGTSVSDGPQMREREANNTLGTANRIATKGVTANATVSSATDVDFFAVTVPAGQTLVAAITPAADLDIDAQLLDAASTELVSAELFGRGSPEQILWKNNSGTARTVYVRAFWYDDTAGFPTGDNTKYGIKFTWK